jgi:FkbM family methyltransferase
MPPNVAIKGKRMKTADEPANPFVGAYSLVKRSGLLETQIGRRLFKSAYFFYKRHIEDDLQGLLQAFPSLVRGGNVLDVGANIGYTATVLARAAEPGRKVYAFEPEPANFRILEQTAHQPEFDGKIVALQCAVGAADGTIDLWVNDRHHGDHRVITEQFRSEHPGAKQVSVDLVSVDSFLKSRQENISFVKIDVQGYELAVCQGMWNTLRDNPEISVFLEYMPSAMRDLGFEPLQLIDFFVERDFKIYQVSRGGELSQGISAVSKDSAYVNLLFSHRLMKREGEA